MVLDGIVLGRQAEGVKADREQNVIALHPALAADDVHCRERARMADVQALAGGVRELDQAVKLRPRVTGDGCKGLFFLPARLPFFLDRLEIVLHNIHFSLKNQKIISRSRGGAMVRPGWFLLVL